MSQRLLELWPLMGYYGCMSYAAIEVELREGRVIARGSDPLPLEAEGLLVIRTGDQAEHPAENQAWELTLATIRNRQLSRGYVPQSAASALEELSNERASWD